MSVRKWTVAEMIRWKGYAIRHDIVLVQCKHVIEWCRGIQPSIPRLYRKSIRLILGCVDSQHLHLLSVVAGLTSLCFRLRWQSTTERVCPDASVSTHSQREITAWIVVLFQWCQRVRHYGPSDFCYLTGGIASIYTTMLICLSNFGRQRQPYCRKVG